MRRLAILCFVLAGCVDPSIPIPPPDPTELVATIMPVGNGATVSFTYPPENAYKGGVCEVYDRATAVGTINGVNADGSCGPTSPLAATLGDNVVFTIVSGSQTVSTCVVLREGQQDPTQYCQ